MTGHREITLPSLTDAELIAYVSETDDPVTRELLNRLIKMREINADMLDEVNQRIAKQTEQLL